MNAPASPPTRVRAVAFVPARLDSTRLARKMLLAETGTPLVVHTAKRAAQSRSVERVIVATDSEEILAAVHAAGVEGVLTRTDHASGTDRVLEALDVLGVDCDVALNVQGDEPELDREDLDRLIAAFASREVCAATLAAPLLLEIERESPDVVKVVRDACGDALYFSRAPIPCRSRARAGAEAPTWRHVGVYAFRPEALRLFCTLEKGLLEATENLEQLRWLEAGLRMRVVPASAAPPGIDTRADYDAFVRRHRDPVHAASPVPPPASAAPASQQDLPPSRTR